MYRSIGKKAFANSVEDHTEAALSLEEIRFVPSEGPDWSPSLFVRPCESVKPLLSVPPRMVSAPFGFPAWFPGWLKGGAMVGKAVL